jgi:hypothetical protein
MPRMTVGMATYNDFDGVYFTIQALRLYQDMQDVELLVVDNFGCDATKRFVEGWTGGRYLLRNDIQGTAAPRDLVFREAAGEIVLCCDSHVLFPRDAIARLKRFYDEHPDCDDLLQGPLLYDDGQLISTHLDPVWREEFWGIWATDPRGVDPDGEPFEIPMQGLGAFACRRSAWLGFNPRFRGFGGEEGYIHEKFRQAGHRTLCLPWFRWMHRFGRPSGVPYRLTLEDKFRNYFIGHAELGLDLSQLIAQFTPRLPEERVVAIAVEALWESAPIPAPSPPNVSNGVSHAPEPERRIPTGTAHGPERRAIVCFVDDKPHLVQQALALRHSWLHASSPDTDLVVMGPAQALARFPDDVVKVPQTPVDRDAAWHGYNYVNSIACMNGDGAERLDQYMHLLRTDVDTFITPAWNDFHPTTFTCGTGGYSNDEDVRQRLREIAARYGLVHRGLINVGSTWYGPTEVVRRASAFAEMLTKHILTHYFATDEGAWPGWYRGVTLLYAGEIAVNHCAPDAMQSVLLDAGTTSRESVARFPHLHCWHTDDKFSKHAFMCGRYTLEDARDLDLDIVNDYCLAMSFRALGDLVPSAAPLIRTVMDRSRAARGDTEIDGDAAIGRVLASAAAILNGTAASG